MSTNGDTSAVGHGTRQGLGQRYSIRDAARVLDLTEEAVRQRVKRGTLDSIKVGGSLFVLLDTDIPSGRSDEQDRPVREVASDTSRGPFGDTSRLVESLTDEVAHLRRQLEQANERDRENRRIIAALTTRIPELPPAQASNEPLDEPAAPVSPSGGEGNDTSTPGKQEPAKRRSWLYRFFFGP